MSEYLFLIPITIALVLGVISPGPSFFLIAKSAMSTSRANALFVALGLGTGAMLLALIACSGVYLLLTQMPTLFLIFKLLGGCYLLFLSFQIFKYAKAKSNTTCLQTNTTKDYIKSFLLGLFTQLSNPKTAIIIGGIIAAFLPQEIPQNSYFFICLIAFILDSSWYSSSCYCALYKKSTKNLSKLSSSYQL